MAFLGVEYGCKFTLDNGAGARASFNDPTDPDFVGVLDPEQCSGLDSPDVREDAQDRTEDDGGIHGGFYYGRRPIVLGGTVIASSVNDRNEKVSKIKAASNAMRSNATLYMYPVGGPAAITSGVRRQQPLRVTKGYVKEFQIALVAADPKLYSNTSTTFKFAGTQSFKSSSTWSSAAGSGGSKVWTNPGNVAVSDNSYATASVAAAGGGEASKTQWLLGKSFGFSLPTNAIITAFQTTIENKISALEKIKFIIKHLDAAGAVVGTGVSSTEFDSITDTTQSFVTGADGITASIANSANFGVAVAFENVEGAERTISIDQILLQLNYIVSYETITNEGNAESFPSIKITGPISSPITIKNATSGKTLKIEEALTIGQYIIVNTANRTIVKNGTTNIYKALSFENSSWWGLLPGANKIEISMTGTTTASQYEITYESAWL